jgi:hypothetical protein
MKQFDAVWLSELQPGDRFYFITDKKKIAWQIKEHKTKKIGFSSGHPHILRTIIWQPEMNTSDASCKHVQDHQVIFLRHTEPVNQKTNA